MKKGNSSQPARELADRKNHVLLEGAAWLLGFGILNRSDEPRKGGAHKAPYLYSFDLKNYQDALKQGLRGDW